MDVQKLADAILEVADRVTPLIPGATDDVAVAGAKAVVNLIDTFHEVTGSTVEELESRRDDLEARVLSGLRDEADRLRGD